MTPQPSDMQGITPLFTEDNIQRLSTIMQLKKVKKGEFLYREGDPADRLYYIQEGGVRITKLTEAGKSFVLYLHQAGDLFGQMDPYPRSIQTFSAEVTEDAVIGAIPKKELELMLWQHGDLAMQFMKWMGLIHRMTESKFRDLLLYGKPGALCSLLIRLGNSYGVQKGGHTLITYRLSNTELAEMIGTTREGVNRMLSEMKKAGAVDFRNGHIMILDADYLRNICHCENCPKEICRM